MHAIQLSLTEFTDKTDILQTYDIYKHCMYMPTKEKFCKKAADFQNDQTIRIFACFMQMQLVGIIVLSLDGYNRAEIVGIAVDPKHRHQGIGSFMLNRVQKKLRITSLYAETDQDAVDFYRKNSFRITAFSRHYNDKTVTRYQCELRT